MRSRTLSLDRPSRAAISAAVTSSSGSTRTTDTPATDPTSLIADPTASGSDSAGIARTSPDPPQAETSIKRIAIY
jgi:hypothetical protein